MLHAVRTALLRGHVLLTCATYIYLHIYHPFLRGEEGSCVTCCIEAGVQVDLSCKQCVAVNLLHDALHTMSASLHWKRNLPYHPAYILAELKAS